MWKWYFVLAPFALLAADQAWKDKQIAQWTDDDAKQVLTDSPWAKPATAAIQPSSGGQRGGRGGGMGRGVGLGIPGMGGIGGMGGGRRGGMGYPGGGYPNGGGTGSQGTGYPGGQGGDRGSSGKPPDLTVRWESALPVQQAELKLRNTDAPTVDESHYAIVVTGVPNRFAGPDSRVKPKGELKREGQKTIKASDVKVLPRDDGNTVVFLFPRSKEITAKDTAVDFEAVFGALSVKQTFSPSQMVWDGKLEL
jgi:hypothetical protein